MNPFSLNHKNLQPKSSERLKIKSKYFGEYQPQVFIASKSKSKSKSTSKGDINNLKANKSQLTSKIIKPNAQNLQNHTQTITINPQTGKSPRSFNSENLSEYLLTRSTSSRHKKSGSAIEKIIEWVERKYFEKIANHKIDKGSPLSILKENRYTLANQQQKFQESLKKFAYDAYIMSRLKSSQSVKVNSLAKTKKIVVGYSEEIKFQSKENDIDNINISLVKQTSKAEDFDIYKFKKNQNYSTDVNLLRISQLSIENISRSNNKIMSHQNLPDNQQFAEKQQKIDLPTMNTFESFDIYEKTRTNSQKDAQNEMDGSQNRGFLVQTARSTSTNQIMETSKHSSLQNSDIHLKAAYQLKYMATKKLKNETGLCQIDNWPNTLFRPQKRSDLISPIGRDHVSTANEQTEQILTEIFQMNENQQNILKTIGFAQSSVLFSSKNYQKTQTMDKQDSIIKKIEANNNSQISKPRKSLAQNYFTMHLAPTSLPNQIKTYQMPLAKANTNIKLKMTHNSPSNIHISGNILNQNKSPNKQVFTFNSLNPQNNTQFNSNNHSLSVQNKKPQTNAFAQKCNIFGICTAENIKQLQRSNHFTDMSTSRQQRGPSVNSNHSKPSSKPKVSFNYTSPSSKNLPSLSKAKEEEGSILFKSQSSQLKNTGNAPVRIDIKPSRENKQNQNKTVKEVVPSQVRQFILQSHAVERKERSQSVPHFTINKVAILSQQTKNEKNYQPVRIVTEKKIQTKNAFVTAGYGPSYYYQSQKVIPTPAYCQGLSIQANYQSAQSYYFPGIGPTEMGHIDSKTNRAQLQVIRNHTNKDKQGAVPRNDNRYLYPIQNSVQRQRTQRAKSLCEMIMVTVKKGQC